MAEKSAAEKSNLKNRAANGTATTTASSKSNDSSLSWSLTATETTRKTDQNTATTATEKTTLNQVHSGPKSGSTILYVLDPDKADPIWTKDGSSRGFEHQPMGQDKFILSDEAGEALFEVK